MDQEFHLNVWGPRWCIIRSGEDNQVSAYNNSIPGVAPSSNVHTTPSPFCSQTPIAYLFKAAKWVSRFLPTTVLFPLEPPIVVNCERIYDQSFYILQLGRGIVCQTQ